MSTFSLTVVDGELRVDSRVIAAQLGVEHESTRKLIRDFEASFTGFGKLRFEIAKIAGRGQSQKFYLLNEDQAIFLLTLTRNTEQAVFLKIDLVKLFSAQRRALEATAAPAPVAVAPSLPSRPSFLPISAQQWLAMNEKIEDIAQCCSMSPDWARFALNERLSVLFMCPEHPDDIPAEQWPAVVRELDELWALGQEHHARQAAAEEDFILTVLRPSLSIAQQRIRARRAASSAVAVR